MDMVQTYRPVPIVSKASARKIHPLWRPLKLTYSSRSRPVEHEKHIYLYFNGNRFFDAVEKIIRGNCYGLPRETGVADQVG